MVVFLENMQQDDIYHISMALQKWSLPNHILLFRIRMYNVVNYTVVEAYQRTWASYNARSASGLAQ